MPAMSGFGRHCLGSEQLKDVALGFCVKVCVAEADSSVSTIGFTETRESVEAAGAGIVFLLEERCQCHLSLRNSIRLS